MVDTNSLTIWPSPSPLSSHLPQLNTHSFPLFRLLTTTLSRNHPFPIPLPSCPTRSFVISPRSTASMANASMLPRSKLFPDDSSFFSSVSPLSPKSFTNTFASVPAPRTSPVFTEILYLIAVGRRGKRKKELDHLL